MMEEFDKKLTTYGLTMIAIGACIGSGIFKTPAGTLSELPHPYWVFLPWILGGIATYFGAMTFAELGARFPKSGGVYVYLKEAYGPLVGFLYGWIILFIVNTGAIAALSVAFTDYLGYFVTIPSNIQPVVACLTILGLSTINSFGVGVSQGLSNVFTGLKLLALFVLVLLGIVLFAKGSYTNFGDAQPLTPAQISGGLLAAFVGVFWSFGGWHHATYLSGETLNPQRTIPRAMLIGTLTVMIIYITVIFAYIAMAPISVLMVSDKIAGDALQNIFSFGGKAISIVITVSIFGTIAIYTMSAPRIYHAMAQDGIFFRKLALIHPKYKTPHYAIFLQAIWACLLVLLWSKFTKLITFVTFMDIVFMALATMTIFVFRNRGGYDRSSNTFFLKSYPWTPGIYLLISLSFVGYTLVTMQAEALIGMVILVLGIPAYFYFRKQKLRPFFDELS